MDQAKELRRKQHAMCVLHKVERLRLEIAKLQQQLSGAETELNRLTPVVRRDAMTFAASVVWTLPMAAYQLTPHDFWEFKPYAEQGA